MNATFLLEGLLRYSYLPVQKKDRSEIPPFLSTFDLTPQIAKGLVAVQKRAKADGWDSVEYQATRFNGVGRILSIPHPLPYCCLCFCLYDNWANLDYCTHSAQSMVKPRQHRDGRVVIMDYEKQQPVSVRLSFGKCFHVKTDISNCFPSIYSHAVSWAVVGFAHAKAHKQPRCWFNRLDARVRGLKRNETQGVGIGPAVSNVVAELILTRVDAEMEKQGFEFIRYIDDYSAYCATEEQAQRFVQTLSEELKRYKLLLNIRKTKIEPLPCLDDAAWVAELALLLPSGAVNQYAAERYLQKAQAIAHEEPDGSALKYAVKSLLARNLAPAVEREILPQVLNLAFYQPILLPLINLQLQRLQYGGVFPFRDQLIRIALENAQKRRSDGLCWALFYLNRHRVGITSELAKAVVDSRDCLGMLLLYLSGNPTWRAQVIAFAQSLDSSDLYALDQYWLLLYKLFCDGAIQNPYTNEGAFQFLQSNNVRFIK